MSENIEKKPNLEKAILLCYHKLSEESFKFSDFKFLLLKDKREQGRKKPLSKEQKQLFKKWEIELKDFLFKWKSPFKSYDYKTSYLSKTLTKMVAFKILDKHDKRYFLPSTGYYNLAKTNLMFNINRFPEKHIIRLYDDKLNLYGINPYIFENDNKVIHLKLNELENVFEKVKKIVTDINCIQSETLAEKVINEIKTGSYPKKDVKLALKYLKKRMIEPDHKKLAYKWVDDKGNARLLYIPKNYLLDMDICRLVEGFLNVFIDYFFPKPVVYTYEPKEKDITQFENLF